ncbi:MAG: M20/M25/M40 family metallo-hydrolase [Thermoanaerobaculia bacterium]
MISRKMQLFPTDLKDHKVGRAVLYGGIVVVLGSLILSAYFLARPVASRLDESWMSVDFRNLREVRLLREYVQINTNADSGSELEGARFLAKQLEEAGITATIESLGERRANLWAIIEGSKRDAVVLHNHIDVSPVLQPDKWTYPPFGGVMKLPWLYGRGTFDMKSVAIAQLLAMIDLKRSGVQPERSVIFLATGGEESGSDLGARWILRQHPELVERFWGVLTEGGIAEASSADKIKYWGVEVGQRKYVNVYLCGESRSQLENVSWRLRYGSGQPLKGRVTQPIREFLQAWAPTRDHPLLKSRLQSPDALALDAVELDGFPHHIQSLFLSEANPFAVEELPGSGFQLRVVLQLLAGADLQQVRRELLPDWLTHGLTVIVEDPLEGSSFSSLDHPLYLHAESVLEDNLSGSGKVGPWILTWSGTDARFFRAVGIPTYGFSPFITLGTFAPQIDRANERIALPGYVAGVEIYAELLRRIAD